LHRELLNHRSVGPQTTDPQTQAALIRLCEGISIETEEYGVTCIVIHPGVVHTGISDYCMDTDAGRKWMPAYAEALEGATPVEWASELTNFLASGAADGLSAASSASTTPTATRPPSPPGSRPATYTPCG
jgi:NAD(P)-dependent dehydrogenase (short-subunit alcohol dehydrogenase family)